MVQVERDVMRTHPDMHFFTGDTPDAEAHREVGARLAVPSSPPARARARVCARVHACVRMRQGGLLVVVVARPGSCGYTVWHGSARGQGYVACARTLLPLRALAHAPHCSPQQRPASCNASCARARAGLPTYAECGPGPGGSRRHSPCPACARPMQLPVCCPTSTLCLAALPPPLNQTPHPPSGPEARALHVRKAEPRPALHPGG